MIFDVLEVVAQNLVLIALVLLIVINISVGLGFLISSNYLPVSDEVVSVFVSFENYLLHIRIVFRVGQCLFVLLF